MFLYIPVIIVCPLVIIKNHKESIRVHLDCNIQEQLKRMSLFLMARFIFYSEIALAQKLLLLHCCKGHWMLLGAVYKDIFEYSAILKLLPSLS